MTSHNSNCAAKPLGSARLGVIANPTRERISCVAPRATTTPTRQRVRQFCNYAGLMARQEFDVAQLEEQGSSNPSVAGSRPVVETNLSIPLDGGQRAFVWCPTRTARRVLGYTLARDPISQIHHDPCRDGYVRHSSACVQLARGVKAPSLFDFDPGTLQRAGRSLSKCFHVVTA